MLVTRTGMQAYALATSVVVVDQVVKLWFLGFGLERGESLPLVGPIRLTMVWNQGVSFGLLRADHDILRWLLVLFAVGVAAGIAWWTRNCERLLTGMGFGLIIGGAVGNAIDRARFGAVVDFLDVTQLMFPWVFNVADSAISVGVVLLLLDSFRREPVAA